MSDNNNLDPFRNNDGSPSSSGQQNAGLWESQNYQQPSTQQSWESWDDYTTRVGAFNSNKQGS